MTSVSLYATALLLSLAASANAANKTPAKPVDQAIKAARHFMMTALPGECDDSSANDHQRSLYEDRAYHIKWRERYSSADDPDQETTLYEIFCMAGAYNMEYAYVLKDQYGQMSMASFAGPEFDLQYADDDNDTYTKLKSAPKVTGYSAQYILTNSDFDPKTNTVSEGAKWRGIADAWSTGSWIFKDGRFVLTKYIIDPIYEDNLDNPPKGIEDKSFQLFPPVPQK